MDPLSITASIIAILQAANGIISLCYDMKACLNNEPWSLTRILEEVIDLRNILETLERLRNVDEGKTQRPAFDLLCEPTNGPLTRCLKELKALEALLGGEGNGRGGTRRPLLKVLGWRIKDGEAKNVLERVERCKSTLTLAVTADEASLLLDIRDMNGLLNTAVEDLGSKLENLVVGFEDKEKNEKQRGLQTWLSPVDPTNNHETALQIQHQGTSDWFIRSQAFTSWKRADRSFLLLTGFPGAGKTLIFCKVVDYLFKGPIDSSSENLVAYFYCDFRESETEDPVNVVGSLVAQLCSQLGWCPDELELEFDRSIVTGRKQRRPTLKALKKALLAFARLRPITLLIDGLDECGEREDILHFLSGFQNEEGQIKIMISSRDEIEIRQALGFFTQVRIENFSEEMKRDIRGYIFHRLQADKKLKSLSESMKREITNKLNAKSFGMFRWVQCQLDAIATLRTVRDIRAALQELPRGLNETYERILQKVRKSDVEIVRRILLWLALSESPLTLEEVHEAVAIEPGSDCLDDEARLSSPYEILSVCGSLTSLSDHGHIRLAHLSVREFLFSPEIRQSSDCSSFSINPQAGNNELAISCLTYLFLRELALGPCPTLEQFQDRTWRYTLIKHAAVEWSYYARDSVPSKELKDLIHAFFREDRRNNFMSWVQVLNAGRVRDWDIFPRHATSLYYAASFGLVDTVKSLLQEGVDINAPGSRFGGTALHAAVLREHILVIKILLEAGADPNQADFKKLSPLHSAVAGHIETMVLLLDYGALISAADDHGETPYMWAVEVGPHAVQNYMQALATHEKNKK